MSTFTVQAPRLEEKWYAVAELNVDELPKPLEIGRVGAHIRKYGHLSSLELKNQTRFFYPRVN